MRQVMSNSYARRGVKVLLPDRSGPLHHASALFDYFGYEATTLLQRLLVSLVFYGFFCTSRDLVTNFFDVYFLCGSLKVDGSRCSFCSGPNLVGHEVRL